MPSKHCSKGMILRKGYVAKRGSKNVKVGSSCIKATSRSGKRRSDMDKAYVAKRNEIHKKMSKKYGHPGKCPPGKIERAGFTKEGYERKSYKRKSGVAVRATRVGKSEVGPVCVKSKGKHGYKIPVHLEKGVLKKFGYSGVKNLSVGERHDALKKAYENTKNPLSLFRQLIILSTMNEVKDKKAHEIFHDDAYWVRSNFGLSGSKSSGGKSSGSKTRGRKSSKTSKSRKSKSKSRKSKSKSRKSQSKSRSKSRSR